MIQNGQISASTDGLREIKALYFIFEPEQHELEQIMYLEAYNIYVYVITYKSKY